MTWVSSKMGGMPMAFLDLFFFPDVLKQTHHVPSRSVGVILNSSVFQGKISKIGELSHCFQLRGPGPGAFKTRFEPPRLLRPSGALAPAPPGNPAWKCDMNLTWMINVQENMSEIRKQP